MPRSSPVLTVASLLSLRLGSDTAVTAVLTTPVAVAGFAPGDSVTVC